jgi:hypothetical protein
LKELVPATRFFGPFALYSGPIAEKPNRVVPDFVPTDRHRKGMCADKPLSSIFVVEALGNLYNEGNSQILPHLKDCLWQ